MDTLISEHHEVALGEIFKLADIISRKGVSPRYANGTSNVGK